MPLQRSPSNPILTRRDLPPMPPAIVDPSSVFNPGAVRNGDETYLLLRVQTRGRETHLVPATSADGVRFEVGFEPIRIEGLETLAGTIHHVYDPRITRLDDAWFVTVAIDLDDTCRTAVIRSDDLLSFRLVGLTGDEDMRNAVLFPERVGGRYLRLDRPNRPTAPGDPPSGSEVVLFASDDLLAWEPVGPVFTGRPRSWDERIGAGPPPVKTRDGWLLLYHGIATHFGSVSIYQAGAVLLDLADPSRVVARTRRNVLEPRETYELLGQVPNVVFPSGLTVDDVDEDGFALPGSRVCVYYGAADTCVGLATATMRDILRACRTD